MVSFLSRNISTAHLLAHNYLNQVLADTLSLGPNSDINPLPQTAPLPTTSNIQQSKPCNRMQQHLRRRARRDNNRHDLGHTVFDLAVPECASDSESRRCNCGQLHQRQWRGGGVEWAQETAEEEERGWIGWRGLCGES